MWRAQGSDGVSEEAELAETRPGNPVEIRCFLCIVFAPERQLAEGHDGDSAERCRNQAWKRRNPWEYTAFSQCSGLDWAQRDERAEHDMDDTGRACRAVTRGHHAVSEQYSDLPWSLPQQFTHS